MPRSSVSSQVPSASRIVRRPTEAPRQLTSAPPFGGAARSGKAGPCAVRETTDKSPHRAFETACLPHQAELYGVAMRIARDPDMAKDLVQETLMRAMIAWSSFEQGSNLRAWLFRI